MLAINLFDRIGKANAAAFLYVGTMVLPTDGGAALRSVADLPDR